ncbi:MAG: hypothetical protein EZS28_020626 [Streblomastix strix]|uniref:Uncharacterized protein n=1 Tax=Streblomastix strix TaxID=222440 RepID=A0A5J4VNF5_9EUKA|nr:MAG: hypothetical protein EZS28_020626 [Streblomastix strix]
MQFPQLPLDRERNLTNYKQFFTQILDILVSHNNEPDTFSLQENKDIRLAIARLFAYIVVPSLDPGVGIPLERRQKPPASGLPPLRLPAELSMKIEAHPDFLFELLNIIHEIILSCPLLHSFSFPTFLGDVFCLNIQFLQDLSIHSHLSHTFFLSKLVTDL